LATTTDGIDGATEVGIEDGTIHGTHGDRHGVDQDLLTPLGEVVEATATGQELLVIHVILLSIQTGIE